MKDCNLLHTAIHNNDLMDAENLLNQGCNPNQQRYFGIEGLRPIHLVNSTQAIDLLLNYGADVNGLDLEGFNALWKTTDKHHLFSYLVDKNCNINCQYINRQQNLLHWRDVSLFAAQKLIDAGLDVNSKDLLGETPLYKHSDINILKLLLNNGADLTVLNKNGVSPFERVNHIDNFFLMFKHIKESNKILNVNDETLIHMLIRHIEYSIYTSNDIHPHEIVVSNIFNEVCQSVNVNLKDDEGNTALHLIALDPELSFLIKSLFDKNIKIDIKNKKRKTALQVAIENNNHTFLSTLENLQLLVSTPKPLLKKGVNKL